MRYLVASFLIVGLFVIPWIAVTFPHAAGSLAAALNTVTSEFAAVILNYKPVSVQQLKTAYENAGIPGQPKIRILVVPGHEPDYGGAEYGKLKERDLNVELADQLVNFLTGDERFQVFESRNSSGWNPLFTNYFADNWNVISSWEVAHKTEIQRLIGIGQFVPKSSSVFHNDAPGPVANRIYGIDKWANENHMDIVIHVHFNDYPRSNDQEQGKYTGFAIYVPERQYYNSSTTKAVAETVFNRLKKYNPVSDLPGEKKGIVEDQELIAVGSFNSVDAASMLVEYSYIYEPQVTNKNVRAAFLQELAYETYLGVTDFFDKGKSAELAHTFDTLTLPYHWEKVLTGKGDDPDDVFALQTALMIHGDYPPQGTTLSDCPRTGTFGGCTRLALKQFQEDYGIKNEKGIVGEKTIEKLNDLYSNGSLTSSQ